MKQILVDKPNKTSQLHTVLHIAVGEKTDISLNLRTDDGLTNVVSHTYSELVNHQASYGCSLTMLILVRKQDKKIYISMYKILIM